MIWYVKIKNKIWIGISILICYNVLILKNGFNKIFLFTITVDLVMIAVLLFIHFFYKQKREKQKNNSLDSLVADGAIYILDGTDNCRRADYSGGFWAICPDFESHHSREWEPAKISDFGLIIVSVRKALVKAANAPLMRLRPW